MKRSVVRILVFAIGLLILFVIGLAIYVRIVAHVEPPVVTGTFDTVRTSIGNGVYALGNNRFRKSESGLYELYVEGDPFERGLANGVLTKELVQRQEAVFNEQIRRLVPSRFYLELLRYFVGWFNRDLDENVPEEFKQEILGVSQSASHDFDYIAPPYQRLLNYHAAHDIGHALQNMSLVGCTSFATWGSRSYDSGLLVGRNFDFYVGDDFARDKIVAFYKPSQGIPFMMITWGGMTGVLSGMNSKGLTVTINAAKSDIPSGSATPVSLVAREILQYASTIDEAYAIAQNRRMFVSESFLIGSSKGGRAALIEKTPDATVLYDTPQEWIISTNHFQSKELGATELNRKHMQSNATTYRYKRVEELLGRSPTNTVGITAGILRNQLGMNDSNLGLGNEKCINQLIAHHAIIFQPGKLKVWVSTAPWQLGKFVCYDLEKVLNSKLSTGNEVYDSALTIPPDPFLHDPRLTDYIKFSAYRFPFQPRDGMQPDSLVKWNPDCYLSYMLAGDFDFDKKDYGGAKKFYEMSLAREIANAGERDHINKNLQYCKDHTK